MKIILNKRTHILENYNQIELFAYWLDISVESIEYCLEYPSNTINNPKRVDRNPSLGFMFQGSKLVTKDWANDTYTGDIFHWVGLLNNLDSNSGDFVKICDIILDNNEKQLNSNHTEFINTKAFTSIKFIDKDFSKLELEFWNKLGVNIKHLNYRNVFSADIVYINNVLFNVAYSNPCFTYWLSKHKNEDIIQLYKPFDNEYKFKTNCKFKIQDISEIYDAEGLIITKSRKDKLTLEANITNSYDDNTIINMLIKKEEPEYCILTFRTESIRLDTIAVDYLKSKYDFIVINVDFDREGIYCAFYHYILYNFIPVFIGAKSVKNDIFDDNNIKVLFKKILEINNNVTLHKGLLVDFVTEHFNKIEEKDVSDYINSKGLTKGRELINNKFNIDNFRI